MSIIQQVCDRLSKQEIEILVEKMGKVVDIMDEPGLLSEKPRSRY